MAKIKKSYKSPYFSPTAKTQTQPVKAGRQNPDAIIAKITDRFKDRSRKDIRKWRQAIALTEHPDKPRYDLYFDLVDDLKTDGKFQSQVFLRKTATLAMDFQVKNKTTGEINEKATDLLRQKWFYRVIEEIIDATVFGVRLIEFDYFLGNSITFAKIPQRNIVAQQKRVYPDFSRPEYFIDYDLPQHDHWLLEINADDTKGLVNNIIPNLIWKRNVAQSWAEFCEKFGMPLVSATTNNSNTAHIDKVEQQLLSLAEASVGVFPEGTTIKFDEANRTDAYQVYQKFIDMNTSEISSLIVGSNTLSDDASNRAQTEVHERSLDDKISKSDRREIGFIVNDELIPILQAHGYSFFNDQDTFEFIQPKEDVSLLEYWSIVQGVMQQYELEQDWLSETFNIPIVGKRANPFAYGRPFEEEEEEPEAAYRPNYPKKKVATQLPQADSGILDRLTAMLIKNLHAGKDTLGIQGQLVAAEGNELLKALKKGYGVTAGWNTPDNLAYQLMEYNLFEFTASKTEARLAAMTELLHDKEKNRIRSFEEFKKLAEKEVSQFNKNWLETEYNLSVAVGQTSAAYHRFLNEMDDVTSYVQYQTAGDDKVRDSHAALDGQVFSLKDKEAMDLWPPNGYNCRCEMIQFIGDPGQVSKGKVGKKLMNQDNPNWEKSQFNINRGDLKQVFTKEQFYHNIKGLPKKLNDMDFEKYNLKPWSNFKQDLKALKIDETITGDNVKELFKKVGKESFMRFTDYNGRKLIMTEDVFKNHTTGKYLNPNERRHQLFPHLKDILKNPDEVWMNEYERKNKFQSNYVKFYKDKTIIINATLDENRRGIEINSWFPLKIDEKKLRKGLLIKKGKGF